MSPDHVVYNAVEKTMRCESCGATRAVPMPISIDDFVEESEVFLAAHNGCAPSSGEPRGPN